MRVVAFYPRRVRGKKYRPLRVGHVCKLLVTQARYPQRRVDLARSRSIQNTGVVFKRRGQFRAKTLHGPLLLTIRRRRYAAFFSRVI